MSKINLTEEVLRHTDDEIIEYLYGVASQVYRAYNELPDDPAKLLTYCGDVEQIYHVLKALNRRNKEKGV